MNQLSYYVTKRLIVGSKDSSGTIIHVSTNKLISPNYCSHTFIVLPLQRSLKFLSLSGLGSSLFGGLWGRHAPMAPPKRETSRAQQTTHFTPFHFNNSTILYSFFIDCCCLSLINEREEWVCFLALLLSSHNQPNKKSKTNSLNKEKKKKRANTNQSTALLALIDGLVGFTGREKKE